MDNDDFHDFFPNGREFSPKQVDSNEEVFRVFDLYKFVDLISRRELHFSRLDTFWKNDPSEGRWTEAEIAEWKKTNFNAQKFNDWNASRIGINCWSCIQNQFNTKLWAEYCQTRYGVGLVSTPNKINQTIRKGLKNLNAVHIKFFSCLVEYKNLQQDNLLGPGKKYLPNIFLPVLRKSAPDFDYEQEVRIVIDAGHTNGVIMQIEEAGLKISFEETDWINRIILPPKISKNSLEAKVIEQLCDKFNFNVPIHCEENTASSGDFPITDWIF